MRRTGAVRDEVVVRCVLLDIGKVFPVQITSTLNKGRALWPRGAPSSDDNWAVTSSPLCYGYMIENTWHCLAPPRLANVEANDEAGVLHVEPDEVDDVREEAVVDGDARPRRGRSRQGRRQLRRWIRSAARRQRERARLHVLTGGTVRHGGKGSCRRVDASAEMRDRRKVVV